MRAFVNNAGSVRDLIAGLRRGVASGTSVEGMSRQRLRDIGLGEGRTDVQNAAHATRHLMIQSLR